MTVKVAEIIEEVDGMLDEEHCDEDEESTEVPSNDSTSSVSQTKPVSFFASRPEVTAEDKVVSFYAKGKLMFESINFGSRFSPRQTSNSENKTENRTNKETMGLEQSNSDSAKMMK